MILATILVLGYLYGGILSVCGYSFIGSLHGDPVFETAAQLAFVFFLWPIILATKVIEALMEG